MRVNEKTYRAARDDVPHVWRQFNHQIIHGEVYFNMLMERKAKPKDVLMINVFYFNDGIFEYSI